ncbi:MAG: hypothetical protein JXA30_00575 [Deltaproteobacteria bacterium]|nr:hypothetical protein [Deltaproteobacteria bacterium]
MGRTVKKITANTPIKILEQAQATTGLGITETLIAGLEELERSRNRSVLRMLRGKIRLDIDLDKTRR